MDNTQNKQFYIVSLDSGIREEEPVSIEVYNNFSDGSQLVQLNNTVFGVLKKNSMNESTMYIDDYEIIKADIAELLDIDHENTKRIVTEDQNIGVITLLNYSKDIETRISATNVINDIVEYINNGQMSQENSIWISNTLRIPAVAKGNAIKDPTQIESLINLGMFSLTTDIEKKTGMPMDEKEKKALRKNYIRMILFDNLIGRKYRGLDYYLVSSVNEQGKPTWKNVRFAPISISNSLEKDAMVGDNEYFINNRLVDKKVLMNVLFTSFYYEIKKVTESLSEATRLYKDAINRIIYNNTEIEKATVLEDLIDDNLSLIKKHQTEYEKNQSKENKMNKVEKTMATQSLNVRVTAKLDLIQKKYPVNPKDHPELIKNIRKQSKEKKEEVKLMVEKEKSTKSGFASSAIIVSAVAFICGIASGIVYVMMTFGN